MSLRYEEEEPYGAMAEYSGQEEVINKAWSRWRRTKRHGTGHVADKQWRRVIQNM